MAKGLCWTDANVGVAEYMRYWQEHIGRGGQIERSDWDEYWRNLLNEKMATPKSSGLTDLRKVENL